MSVYNKFFIFIIYILGIGIVFFVLRDLIDQLSHVMPHHFISVAGNATRENIYIVEQYDVFFNAPYNMFLAFWGPTYSEVIQKPINGLVFMESLFILFLFIYFIYIFLLKIYLTKMINIMHLSVGFTSVFWILFVHMPFGLFNYGSAIRYRESFYSFLVILLFYIFTKTKRMHRSIKVIERTT